MFQTVQAMHTDGFDISLRVPWMMSDTRFPNYVSMVFSVLRYSFAHVKIFKYCKSEFHLYIKNWELFLNNFHTIN